MGRSRYKVFNGECYPHFFTCTIIDWIPVFVNDDINGMLLASLKFMVEQRDIKLFAYVIMKDHLHFIAMGHGLTEKVGNFKSFTARSIINKFKDDENVSRLCQLIIHKQNFKKGQQYQLWQESSYPKQIFNRDVMRQKVTYIHMNPVRKGYVKNPEDWEYSSYNDYTGKPGKIKIVIEW